MRISQKQIRIALGIVLAYTVIFDFFSSRYLSQEFDSNGDTTTGSGGGGGSGSGSGSGDGGNANSNSNILQLSRNNNDDTSDTSSSSSSSSKAEATVKKNGDATIRKVKVASSPTTTTTTRRTTSTTTTFNTSTRTSFLNDTNASFGACLMLCDDNHFLVEWLAYHYYALPLRHITVLVDENSTTSPIPIFERWKDRIQIDIMYNWTYPDAYSTPPPNAHGTPHEMPSNRKLIGKQLKFYEDCMRRYKLDLNWESWIVLSDPDEFWSLTPMTHQFNNEHKWLYRKNFPTIGGTNSSAGFVMEALKQEYTQEVIHNQTIRINKQSTAGLCWDLIHPECIGVPRMQMCSDTESGSKPAVLSDQLSTQYNSTEFATLRWLSFPWGGIGIRMPKNMIHIGGIDKQYLIEFDALHNGAHPHRILPGRCKKKCFRISSIFQIYHYSGSEEQRTFRRDPRGAWGDRGGSAPVGCEEDNSDGRNAMDLVPWLGAFVNHIGNEVEAKRLLEGVGRVHSWPPYELPEKK